MPKELELADRMEEGNEVIKYWLRGYPPTTIAKQMKIQRKQVLAYIDQWKTIAHDDVEIKDRAREALLGADQHFDQILKELWESISKLGTDHRTKGTLLKNAADIEAKRVDLLKQAGLLDDSEMGDQMAEIERKQEILKGILRDVSLKCPNCKNEVAQRMRKMNPDYVEPIAVEIKRDGEDMSA
jgi:uncharacterized protein with PIN domain